jgi:hypothetical protein
MPVYHFRQLEYLVHPGISLLRLRQLAVLAAPDSPKPCQHSAIEETLALIR